MRLEQHDEMTAAAIARLAGVGRAAVSNWRRRHPSFPKPVGGSSTSPTFSRIDVEKWLAETGKADQLATAGRTETGTQRLGETPERGISNLTADQLLAKVMVSLLPPSTASARSVSADDAEAPVVLDPACSEATLLMAVADRFGDHVKLAGQEIQESAAATAALHLRSIASGGPYEINVGDSLLDNQLSRYLGAAAAVVCLPPSALPQWHSVEWTNDPRWEFGIPSPREGELAWVQHCYAHLRPRGVAVIAVSARTCVQSSGQHIRAGLVRSGALREVIALPKGSGAARCLWVLQRPHGSSDHADVRMVDLSGLSDAAEVPHEFAAWQRLFDAADPTISHAVPRLELLDGETNLLPSRYVAVRAEVTAGDLARVTDRLQALYAHIGQGLPRFAAPKSQVHHSFVTLSELERVGAVTIRSRDTTPRIGDLLLRTLGRPPAVATGTDSDDAGVAQVVELDATRLDSHFVATFLGTDANALPVANTLGALNRDDLRRCRIPRLPLAEQRRYGDVFRYLQELRGALAALAVASTNIIEQTIHGLTVGALTPDLRLEHEGEKR